MILRLRRKIQAFKREVGDTLFISPRYPNEATWREEPLKELPDYFDTIFLRTLAMSFILKHLKKSLV